MTIYRGITFKLVILVKDAAGAAIDLTGASARAQVRKRAAVSSALILDLQPSVTNPTAGEITISRPPAETAALAPQVGKWDLLVDMDDETIVVIPTADIEIMSLATAIPE